MRQGTMVAVVAAGLSLAGCRDRPAPASGIAVDEPRILNPAGAGGAAPMIAVSAAGVRAFSWLSGLGDGSPNRLFVMTDGRAPVELVDTLGEFQADRETPPKLAWAPDGALHILYAVARTDPGPQAFHAGLRVATSRDTGRTWGPPISVTDDGALGKYRNDHALHVGGDGTIYVSWLDQRTDTIRVFATHSTDGGKTWDTNRLVDEEGSCECCRVALTTTREGRAFLAWRKKLPGGIRDIVVARSDDRGVTWSAPVRINADDWEVGGCPDAGPSLAADDAGRLHVGWWTGKPGAAGVKYARSDDGGSTFGAPVVMKIGERSRASHVQVGLGPEKQVVVTWEDGTVEAPRILLRASLDGGTTFGPIQALSAEGMVAGYPVVAIRDREFTVLWQEQTPADQAAHESAAPKDVNWDAMTAPVWRYYNSADRHRVVARTGRLGGG